MTKTYLIIAIPLLILIAIVYPSSSESRRSHYNSELRSHLERLQIALTEFYNDFKTYPDSVPLGNESIALTGDNHKRSFEIFKEVCIILKTNNSQYAAIVGHARSNRFYAISDSSETVYKIQHTNANLMISKDRWFEIMLQSCPPPGEKRWQKWQASTQWNEMDSLPKIALAIVLGGLCLLMAKCAKAVWKGVIRRLFLRGKNKTISAT